MTAQGNKADGLTHLPKTWTSQYVALDRDTAITVAGRPSNRSAAQIARRLEASRIARRLRRLFGTSSDGLLVRSSAWNEEMANRGLYRSEAVTFPTYQTVAEAMLSIWTHAGKLDPDSDPIPVLVQARVVPQLWGHLSNESRLRRDRRDWLAEIHSPIGETVTSGLRALRDDRVPLGRVDLSCGSAAALRNVLRRVAGALTRSGQRVHIEWLWDGDRVWVVQYDRIPELKTPPPTPVGAASRMPETEVFRALRVDDDDLPKARCVADYIRYGLPHAEFLVLRDRDAIGALAAGETSAALARDLEALAGSGAVIRTDTRRTADFEVLLERTDTEFSAAQLVQFLISTTKRLRDRGVPASDIAFIAHPFIPAEASAWSLAAPGSPEVRIDASYGLPDGLLYYSHDSYIVNLRRESVQAHLRQKDRILACDEAGKWQTSPVGAPWDWRSSLHDDEALEIARLSKTLADQLGKPVETMFFVRARTVSGAVRALPWVHRVDGVGQASIPATDSHFANGPAIEVRDPGDIPRLRDALADLQSGERLLIRLRPQGELLHEAEFLKQIIAEMRPERCVVEMEGSALSHVYYELCRAGVQVQATDPIEPAAAEPEAFDKLVRDLIPQRIASKGERVLAYAADGERLSHLLRQKLVEESYEAVTAPSTDGLVEELGDVLDVVDALCALSGTSLDAVKEWAESKRRERGSFERGMVLIETRDRTLDEALTGDGPTFSLSPELGAEVQERRSGARSKEPLQLRDEIVLPYEVPDREPRSVRIMIDGIDLELSFVARGVVIERAQESATNPEQMRLELEG